jgi:DNA-binding response OmpR family regulator
MNILLLEDDNILSTTLTKLLTLEGYNISLAVDANEVFSLTYDNNYDLYLFDINVPILKGTDILKELRQSGDNTPTFFLSALRDIDTISEGFDAGCDDYIKKPFDFDELLVRIRSILKKSYGNLKYKDITYDPNTNIIKQDDKIIHLGTIEQNIFILFIKNKNKLVTKDEIYELLETPTASALRVQISRLKKALNLNITNIRGEGYKLEEL